MPALDLLAQLASAVAEAPPTRAQAHEVEEHFDAARASDDDDDLPMAPVELAPQVPQHLPPAVVPAGVVVQGAAAGADLAGVVGKVYCSRGLRIGVLHGGVGTVCAGRDLVVFNIGDLAHIHEATDSSHRVQTAQRALEVEGLPALQSAGYLSHLKLFSVRSLFGVEGRVDKRANAFVGPFKLLQYILRVRRAATGWDLAVCDAHPFVTLQEFLAADDQVRGHWAAS